MAAKCLRSISGMDPRPLETVREVWEPRFRYDASVASTPGQASQVEQYRLFVVASGGKRFLESYEIPEPGRNMKVVSQSVLSSEFLGNESADVPGFLAELGYEKKSVHVLRGEEYVLHDDVIVHMFQLYSADGELLDESQQNTVIAHVDVRSVRDLQAVQRGTQLLLGIQQELRGVVVLRIPNRNSFNTRMPRLQV